MNLFKSNLPIKGFKFNVGGFMSIPGEIVVDLDKKSMTYILGENKNQQLKHTQAQKKELTLKQQDFTHITILVDKIWTSNKEFNNFPNITADFNVVLTLSDAGRIKMIDSYGPPREEVEELFNFVYDLIK